MPGDTPATVRPSRKRSAPSTYDPDAQQAQGKRHGTSRSSPDDGGSGSTAARAARLPPTKRSPAKKSASKTPAAAARSPSKELQQLAKDMGVGSGSRAAAGYLDTPTRTQICVRYGVWKAVKACGKTPVEDYHDIAAEFGIDETAPGKIYRKFITHGTVGTRAKSGRPEEWTEEASAEMEEMLRDRRKGHKKRSAAGRKLRASSQIVNPQTSKPFCHSTYCKKRTAAGFKARARRSRPILTKLQRQLRLQWCNSNHGRQWIADKDRGIARVFIDEWWAKCNTVKFPTYRRDDSDSDDDYSNDPKHPCKIMSLAAISRDAPEGKVGIWHVERWSHYGKTVYSDKPGEGRTIPHPRNPNRKQINPNPVIIHAKGDPRLDKVSMDTETFINMMIKNVIPAIRNTITMKDTVTTVELQGDNASPHAKAFETLKAYLEW